MSNTKSTTELKQVARQAGLGKLQAVYGEVWQDSKVWSEGFGVAHEAPRRRGHPTRLYAVVTDDSMSWYTSYAEGEVDGQPEYR